jgi:hypothetical protein
LTNNTRRRSEFFNPEFIDSRKIHLVVFVAAFVFLRLLLLTVQPWPSAALRVKLQLDITHYYLRNYVTLCVSQKQFFLLSTHAKMFKLVMALSWSGRWRLLWWFKMCIPLKNVFVLVKYHNSWLLKSGIASRTPNICSGLLFDYTQKFHKKRVRKVIIEMN